jgi:hypothetical protein
VERTNAQIARDYLQAQAMDVAERAAQVRRLPGAA